MIIFLQEPTNFLRDENFLEEGFPRHFLDGKYGPHYNRDKKLSYQQYFCQRIQNVDKRFAKDESFIFVAQQMNERQQLERQIDISVQKGKLVNTDEGLKVAQPNAAFNLLKTIPGSPGYWQAFKQEIFAKLEQLGPFHLFWTLSCAEQEWPEIKAAIISSEMKDLSLDIPGNWDGSPDSITISKEVNGKKATYTLTDYWKNNVQNKSQLFKENIFLITQMFDNRVKSFMKNVFLCPLIKHYSYRIEFQVR